LRDYGIEGLGDERETMDYKSGQSGEARARPEKAIESDENF